jgi:CheY-like chemotaxis protein
MKIPMSKCILIVDDDRVNLEIIKRTLQSKKYEALTAENGLEALEVLKLKKPDLILLDIQMPKVDGYAFIMKKLTDPVLQNIPVIIITAMEKTEPLFKRYGIKAYLLKPVNPKDLLNKIESFLSA